MASRSGDPAGRRRLDGRLRVWLGRRWTRRGLALLLLATGLLLAAGAVGESWRWLVILDGSLFTWLGLSALTRSPARGWPRALAFGTVGYLAAGLAFLAAGTPWTLALGWPYVLVQAGLSCPTGLPCPLGR